MKYLTINFNACKHCKCKYYREEEMEDEFGTKYIGVTCDAIVCDFAMFGCQSYCKPPPFCKYKNIHLVTGAKQECEWLELVEYKK